MTGESRVLVVNPTSGSEDHVDDVVELAGEHGFTVEPTAEPGDARRLAREAAPDADLVAAAGGDGVDGGRTGVRTGSGRGVSRHLFHAAHRLKEHELAARR